MQTAAVWIRLSSATDLTKNDLQPRFSVVYHRGLEYIHIWQEGGSPSSKRLHLTRAFRGHCMSNCDCAWLSKNWYVSLSVHWHCPAVGSPKFWTALQSDNSRRDCGTFMARASDHGSIMTCICIAHCVLSDSGVPSISLSITSFPAASG